MKKFFNAIKTPLSVFFMGGYLFLFIAIYYSATGNSYLALFNILTALFFAVGYVGHRIICAEGRYWSTKKLQSEYELELIKVYQSTSRTQIELLGNIAKNVAEIKENEEYV